MSNIYMRRFILGWKVLGYARRSCSEIVNYADDFCVLGKAPASEMLAGVERIMDKLKLPINEQKTRCLRCPEEPLEFLGYRIGRNFRPGGNGSYIGTRPSKASVQSICREISERTAARYGLIPTEEMVQRLNWMLSGWSSYYHLGQVSPAYAALDEHTTKRLRRWLNRKHKIRVGRYVRSRMIGCGLYTASPALRRRPRAFRGRRHDLEGKPGAGNPHARFDERGTGNAVKGAGLRPGAKATDKPPDP